MIRSLSWLYATPTRGVAFAIHLILSLLVFSTLVAMMLLFWFPGDLFFIDGGWQGLKLVAMVDLVLGPALTLILFKPGKPKLVMDMSMIAAIQLSALAYGFYTTHQQRTVAVVFAENTFNTLSAKANLEANQQLRKLDVQPGTLPPVSLFKLPLLVTPAPDKESYGKFLENILNGYPGPQERSDQYVPMATHHDMIKKNALSHEQLAENGTLESVEKALNKRNLDASQVEFYRFKARYANGVAIFDPTHKRILDYIPAPEKSTNPDEKIEVAQEESN